jgi:hypothetical protein
MRHTDYCDMCGETYHSDNLMTCVHCDREFCYRCGDSGAPCCRRCREENADRAPQDTASGGDK